MDVVGLPILWNMDKNYLIGRYRRVTALVNRQRRDADQAPINAQRVLRIMRLNALVLKSSTARCPWRVPDWQGKKLIGKR